MADPLTFDTSVLVDYFRNHPEAIRLVEAAVQGGPLLLTSPVVAELVEGANSEGAPAGAPGTLDEFLLSCVTLPFGDAAARISGVGRASLGKAGKLPPKVDSMIAAITVENRIRIAARDRRGFHGFPGILLDLYDKDYKVQG